MTVGRQNILNFEFGIDNSQYHELFYSIIDKLIFFKFGKEISDLIFFYIYERINVDGSLNKLLDEQGKELVISNAEDLWNIIIKVKPSLGNLEN